MKIWLRRLLYLFIVIAWLFVMAFPVFAFVLASQGEIVFGDEATNNTRIFLIQERDAEGVGIQRLRQAGEGACVESAVNYFMWEGEGEAAVFCSCASTGASGPGPCP